MEGQKWRKTKTHKPGTMKSIKFRSSRKSHHKFRSPEVITFRFGFDIRTTNLCSCCFLSQMPLLLKFSVYLLFFLNPIQFRWNRFWDNGMEILEIIVVINNSLLRWTVSKNPVQNKSSLGYNNWRPNELLRWMLTVYRHFARHRVKKEGNKWSLL